MKNSNTPFKKVNIGTGVELLNGKIIPVLHLAQLEMMF